jgi:kynurenine--oxoglutarate transaminase/cysteine-S-conjugate beta-lyase/glutamine--phenylpyruvate transaminase
MVGNGATGVLFCATQALLNPGDEVVVFEPAFDIYSAQAAMAGATVRYVPLKMTSNLDERASADTAHPRKQGWSFDIADFEAALTPQTRMVILNTPHNPSGKRFSRAELLDVAAALQRWPDVVVVADEVYEHLVYEGEHVSIGSLTAEDIRSHMNTQAAETASAAPACEPYDMYDRCLTVSSSGKTLACTGWKVGWAVGPKKLVDCLCLATAWVSFSVNTPGQVAVADCLKQIQEVSVVL